MTETADTTQDSAEAVAYFAGGCFWGLEEYFRRISGVTATRAGYAQSKTDSPSYEEVCSGRPDAAETVEVSYDPSIVSLTTLTRLFYDIIDPFSVDRQGNDHGRQYRTGLYSNPANPSYASDMAVFHAVDAQVGARHGHKTAVEISPLKNFYPAEAYHQGYLEKNPGGYCHIDPMKIAQVSKRQKYIDRIYELDDLQYAVTQEAATEQPFANAYDETFEPGIYADIVSGEPLFASDAKYDSGCGWPAFGRPISPGSLAERADYTVPGRERTEVLAVSSGIHLGHVFNDGPQEFSGVRYCINSASLRFIPLSHMEEEGYGEYSALVSGQEGSRQGNNGPVEKEEAVENRESGQDGQV